MPYNNKLLILGAKIDIRIVYIRNIQRVFVLL